MGNLIYFGILVYVLFYGSYLGKQLMLKKQGITSDRLGCGDKPKRTLIIERLLKAATFSMAALQIFSFLMAAVFGEEYRKYKRSVGRYFLFF